MLVSRKVSFSITGVGSTPVAENIKKILNFFVLSDRKKAEVYWAKQVGRMMIAAGVAVWNEINLEPGPNIQDLIVEIENSKKISGGFHPHVANRFLSTIVADWKLSHHIGGKYLLIRIAIYENSVAPNL